MITTIALIAAYLALATLIYRNQHRPIRPRVTMDVECDRCHETNHALRTECLVCGKALKKSP